METIYFSSWVVPVFAGINLFFFFTLLMVFLGFAIAYVKLKDRMYKKSLPYLFLLVIVMGYFTTRPLFQVYLVRVESDGTKILQNCYHITLGKITKEEKITTDYQQKTLRGRSVRTLFLHIGNKTYKTVSATPEQITEANNRLMKQ